MKKNALALFDFDGTITRKDSFIEFVKFAVGTPKLYMGFVIMSPLLALYFLKILPNHRMKEFFLTYFFKNLPESKFQQIASDFSSRKLDGIVKQSALDRIAQHQENNHTVVLVSASVDYWLKDWCQKHNLRLIATQMEVKDKKITGRLASANCYGPEKNRRIKEELDVSQYEYIYAYGDSGGDKEMLAMADEPHYRFFH